MLNGRIFENMENVKNNTVLLEVPPVNQTQNNTAYKNRVINMFGYFDDENCKSIVEQLIKWEEEDSLILYRHSQQINQIDNPSKLLKPIIVNINSPGGNVDQLLAIVDMLNSMTATVITRAIGQACSCGFILFAIGDERYIGNNSMIMYHGIRWGFQGQEPDHANYLKNAKKVQKRIDKMISSRTGVKMKTLEAWRTQPDKWLDAKEAVDLGVATDYLY